jgi:hypothetical protein
MAILQAMPRNDELQEHVSRGYHGPCSSVATVVAKVWRLCSATMCVISFQIFRSQAVSPVKTRKSEMPNMISKNTTHLFLEISPRQLPRNYPVDAIIRRRHCMEVLGMQWSIGPEYRDGQNTDELARLSGRESIQIPEMIESESE